MTVPRNIYAFTALGGSFPEYLSVNRFGDNPNIWVHVRSPTAPNGNGENAFIELTPERARELGLALIQTTN